MMLFGDILSILLRLAELACAAVVLGITTWSLVSEHVQDRGYRGRFIYADALAGLSILLALLWLLPFKGNFVHYPIDFLLAIGWFVAFGLTHRYVNNVCKNSFTDGGFNILGHCKKWQADEAFMFISGVLWLLSALLGMYYVHRHMRNTRKADIEGSNPNRRVWFRANRNGI